MNTTTIQTPATVRENQTIVPEWMEKILSQAEQANALVKVTRLISPFGSYVTGIEVIPAPANDWFANPDQPKYSIDITEIRNFKVGAENVFDTPLGDLSLGQFTEQKDSESEVCYWTYEQDGFTLIIWND